MKKFFALFLSAILMTGVLGCGGGEAETADSGSDSGRSGSSNLSSVGSDPSTSDNTEANARTPNNPVGDSETSGNADTSSETTQVSFNNGLFPQMTTVAVNGFGGALFPNMQPGGNEGSMSKMANADLPAGTPDDDPFDLGGSDSDSDSGFEPNSATAVSIPEPESVAISLLPDAKRLFQKHREQDAINVLYANHLVSDESSKDYLLNWYAGLKEPRLFFRWGVGVIYKEPRDFDGRHPVIGDPGDPNEGGGGRSGRGGNGRPGIGIGGVGAGGGGSAGGGARNYKNIDTSRPDGFLMYYTGDFGKQLISFMEARLNDEQSPYYGLILREVMKVEIPDDEKDVASQRPSNRPPSGRNGRPPGAIGALGALGGEGGGGGRGGGRGGSAAPAQPVVDTNTSIIDRATGSSVATKPEDDFSGSILPGVMLLGAGSKADLVERAQASDVDALIVFNVKVSKSRSSRPSQNSGGRRGSSSSRPPSRTNTTSMKIIDVRSEKAENLFSSKALKAATVLDDNNNGEDPVKEEIEKAFEKVADKLFRASDMPSGLTMDNVRKRVGRIAKSKAEFPLPVAVEIVSFYRQDLLAESDAITALKRVFGTDDAAILIQGSPSQRMEFVKTWLPEGAGE